ncbi:hypothetical protein DVR12_03665 [Chitinophaga silvatica]|uniref:Uncharacterized protein n=1 Tax=Chitinophaga silvatica TaxID=2282649 RepID=A0A3E1YHI9_9BACT|nr:hypothetical protein DVR12_03665 [Chitinophaga silvatica]
MELFPGNFERSGFLLVNNSGKPGKFNIHIKQTDDSTTTAIILFINPLHAYLHSYFIFFCLQLLKEIFYLTLFLYPV